MYTLLQKDLDDISEILDGAKKMGIDYLNSLETLPTSTEDPAVNLPSLSLDGLGALETQSLFGKELLPKMLASSGPRYWGFVTGGATPAAIMGDWLASVFDQNTQNAKGDGDVSAILELHTIKLLLDLFELPQTFFGGFVSGATMSNFSGLAVARQWYGKQQKEDIAREGVLRKIPVYAATPHSSSIKALSMLGIGSNTIQLIPVLEGREAMNIEKLESLIVKNTAAPFILITSGGTVNTVDFDDMQKIAALKKKYNFWWHIDAAFGGFAACSPQYRHLLSGWEEADSITIDFHKWLNVPYDSAVIFTKQEHMALQIQTFQNSNAPYLGDPLEDFNYLNYLPENSRRFRALPAWFTLMAYGKKGYQEIVEQNIRLAQTLGNGIAALPFYELSAPIRLNTVCFTVKDENKKEKISSILKAMNKEGKVFMTPTVYKGIPSIRAALVNWRTTEEDIKIALEELNKAYKSEVV